jgi:DNA polymerase-3 subunit gamma/tau
MIAAPQATATPGADFNRLQQAMAAALADTKGQESASHQVEDAIFALNGDTVEIRTGVSAAMLPLMFNPEAQRLLTQTLRAHNPALRFKLLAGTPASAASSKPKSTRAASAGSAAELAAKHPIVQQAQQLFSADIIRVDDLREK